MIHAAQEQRERNSLCCALCFWWMCEKRLCRRGSAAKTKDPAWLGNGQTGVGKRWRVTAVQKNPSKVPGKWSQAPSGLFLCTFNACEQWWDLCTGPCCGTSQASWAQSSSLASKHSWDISAPLRHVAMKSRGVPSLFLPSSCGGHDSISISSLGNWSEKQRDRHGERGRCRWDQGGWEKIKIPKLQRETQCQGWGELDHLVVLQHLSMIISSLCFSLLARGDKLSEV